MDDEWVTQVHIPRTGGTALREAMRPHRFWRMAGHSEHLDDITTPLATVTVRDPVARFLSVCAWGRDILRSAGYPDAEALALDITALEHLQPYRVMLAPQAAWLGSADYVRSRCFWWGWTETLDDDMERLRALMGLDDSYRLPGPGDIKRNAHPPHVDYQLSPLAAANVRDWYAADYRILEAI